jgi:Leucine-rich repeat (LRR) protein
VPDCLKGLPALEDLSLSGNKITDVPAWVTEWPKLRNVDFDNNPISKLPERLDGWASLQVLSLVRCPLDETEKARIRQALPKVHIAF